MAAALFQPEKMGLRDSISDIKIEDRISYTPQTNTLFLDFSGMRVNTADEVDRIIASVEQVLKPLAGRVVSIVNYDSFWVDPEVFDTSDGTIYIWYDDEGRPARGIIEDIAGIGDIRGVMRE